ncbi:MAG: transglutaminase-like domain-containing protein [Lachnospiraceae bacterium]|nr:transglutaminase-like domain-containing protein [Lachnospiraceae bacterium]
MYQEYEEKIKRLSRTLRKVKKIVLIAMAILIPCALLCFGVGFRYRDLECNSVTYGELPNPSSGISAIGSLVYEYREVYEDGDGHGEWTENVPKLPGEYEVRAHSVSFLGVRRDSEGVKFTIRPKKLTINLADREVYGSPRSIAITDSDWSVEGLVFGDRIAGSGIIYEDDYDATVLRYRLGNLSIAHSDGSDATDCYVIPEKTGTIRDARNYITVQADSRTVVYDGDPNALPSADSWRIISGRLKSGHTAEFHCRPSTTRKGAMYAVNEFDVSRTRIVDEKGNDVSGQYCIEYSNGDLQLLPRKIIITSGSAKKLYDGTPLTNPEYTVRGDGLAEGDRLTISCVGSQTEVGESPNTFSGYYITSDTYGDVTAYYDITLKTGTLRVYRDKTPPPDGGDGGDGGGGGLGGTEGEIVTANEDSFNIDSQSAGGGGAGALSSVTVFSFYGQTNRWYYFKEFSYGNYDGHSWYKTEGEEEFLPRSNYFTGEVLRDAYAVRDAVMIRDSRLPHPAYPYYMTMDPTVNQDGSYICETYVDTLGEFPAADRGSESQYREFVYDNYLDISPELKAELLDYGAKHGLNQYSATLVTDIAECIQSSASYSMSYSFPSDRDMVSYFLNEGKKGICQHFASAATMMYRAYGIPARYTVGFVQKGRPGQWTKVTAEGGHAWTEVYLDGVGWVQMEVTGGSDFSDSADMTDFDFSDWDISGDLFIVYDTVKKEYDGKTLGEFTLEWHLQTGVLQDGHRIEAIQITIDASDGFINPGEYPLEELYDEIVSSIRVVDRNGNPVYDYNIFVDMPTVTITQRDLILTIYADSSDDPSHLRWRIVNGSLVNGHELHVFLEDDTAWSHGIALELGTIAGKRIYAEVLDENGENVTANYSFGYRYIEGSTDW